MLVLITYASCSNSEDSKSQLGYIILIVDDADRANIVHYGPNKTKLISL